MGILSELIVGALAIGAANSMKNKKRANSNPYRNLTNVICPYCHQIVRTSANSKLVNCPHCRGYFEMK